MTGVLEVASTGEYRDERLYILKTVERLENKQDETLKDLTRAKEKLSKVTTDLNESFEKSRKLTIAKDHIEKRLLRMEIKAGSIAALAGFLTAGAIEALRHFL